MGNTCAGKDGGASCTGTTKKFTKGLRKAMLNGGSARRTKISMRGVHSMITNRCTKKYFNITSMTKITGVDTKGSASLLSGLLGLKEASILSTFEDCMCCKAMDKDGSTNLDIDTGATVGSKRGGRIACDKATKNFNNSLLGNSIGGDGMARLDGMENLGDIKKFINCSKGDKMIGTSGVSIVKSGAKRLLNNTLKIVSVFNSRVSSYTIAKDSRNCAIRDAGKSRRVTKKFVKCTGLTEVSGYATNSGAGRGVKLGRMTSNKATNKFTKQADFTCLTSLGLSSKTIGMVFSIIGQLMGTLCLSGVRSSGLLGVGLKVVGISTLCSNGLLRMGLLKLSVSIKLSGGSASGGRRASLTVVAVKSSSVGLQYSRGKLLGSGSTGSGVDIDLVGTGQAGVASDGICNIDRKCSICTNKTKGGGSNSTGSKQDNNFIKFGSRKLLGGGGVCCYSIIHKAGSLIKPFDKGDGLSSMCRTGARRGIRNRGGGCHVCEGLSMTLSRVGGNSSGLGLDCRGSASDK